MLWEVVWACIKAEFQHFPQGNPRIQVLLWQWDRCLNVIQYAMQQIAQSMINNHLSPMSLLHVSASTSSSSGRYIQTHISSESIPPW